MFGIFAWLLPLRITSLILTRMSIGKKLLLVLASVVLLAAGWLHISGLTLLAALVPLLLISHSYDASRRSFWKMAGWTALTIALWSVATVWWVWNAAPIGVLAATVVQVVLFGVVFMIYHYTSKRCRPALANVLLVAGWLAAEYIYLANEQISFPWLVLGNGFANDTWAVQWYEFTGALGGSLWVLVSNLLLFNLILAARRRPWILREALWVLLPLLFSGILGASWRQPAAGEATVTLIQPNIDSYTEKFFMPQRWQDSVLLALAAEAPADADLIVMPETAVEDDLWENALDRSASLTRFRTFLRTQHPAAAILTGATTYRSYPYEATVSSRPLSDGSWYDAFNSALMVGTSRTVTIHHRNKLVIGVEMMPFMKLLKPFTQYIVDLGGTTGQLGTDGICRVFTHRTPEGTVIRTAAPVCYESVYGDYFSGFAAGGAQLICVVTNDGWWGDTPGYRQHFSYSRLRAIETRRWIARSANTGISGFIDPLGRPCETLGWEVRGTLTRTVPLYDGLTCYVRYGDLLGRVGCYVFLLSILYYFVYRVRRRSLLIDA